MTQKYGADKIAFLGLFVVTLLIAHFIVTSKSSIVLSGPIELDRSGLSISIPTGKGWHGDEQWVYHKNTFVLRSVLYLGSGKGVAEVYCNYKIGAMKFSLEDKFEEKASDVGGKVSETGQRQIDTLTIDWAVVKREASLTSMVFGIVQLPNARQLEIKVRQVIGENDLAEEIFWQVVESMKFEDNQLLTAGGEIVENIKNRGIGRFLDDQEQQVCFIIKDQASRTIGFSMDVMISLIPKTLTNIQAATFFYMRGRQSREQIAFFQSDNSFDTFNWKSETSHQIGKSGVEIAMDEDGIMTIKNFATSAEEKTYLPGDAGVPNILLDFVLSELLESDHQEIIVDVIDFDGTIIPMLVSKVEKGDDAAYTLMVEMLDGQGFSEQVYLDDQKRIQKRVLQQNEMYNLERVGVEDIIQEFPERADYIRQRIKYLNSNN